MKLKEAEDIFILYKHCEARLIELEVEKAIEQMQQLLKRIKNAEEFVVGYNWKFDCTCITRKELNRNIDLYHKCFTEQVDHVRYMELMQGWLSRLDCDHQTKLYPRVIDNVIQNMSKSMRTVAFWDAVESGPDNGNAVRPDFVENLEWMLEEYGDEYDGEVGEEDDSDSEQTDEDNAHSVEPVDKREPQQ